MTAYYNEFDPFAGAWLEELIKDGLIANGIVDHRSICDVEPSDLAGFEQCHFFAGIGGWSHALRLAGWPDDRVAWTGSCPCQPFSSAGQRKGHADERHLWPAFHRLIAECRPPALFGEQVASKDGREWFAAVRTDLEDLGYACGAADLCAAGVGAPHIRQRLFFVAHADGGHPGPAGLQRGRQHGLFATGGGSDELADAGREGWRQVGADSGWRGEGSGAQGLDERSLHGRDGELGDANGARPTERREAAETLGHGRSAFPTGVGPWSDVVWLPCRDGRARPTKPGLQPLAHGVPNRVGTLRGAGNAIVPHVGAAFVQAVMDMP